MAHQLILTADRVSNPSEMPTDRILEQDKLGWWSKSSEHSRHVY